MISVISAVKNQSKKKFAMARTPSPARETRALPRIPLKLAAANRLWTLNP
jgi:hypothetical protein